MRLLIRSQAERQSLRCWSRHRVTSALRLHPPCGRHRMGDSPIRWAKRSPSAERERATSCASSDTVQARAGLVCISPERQCSSLIDKNLPFCLSSLRCPPQRNGWRKLDEFGGTTRQVRSLKLAIVVNQDDVATERVELRIKYRFPVGRHTKPGNIKNRTALQIEDPRRASCRKTVERYSRWSGRI